MNTILNTSIKTLTVVVALSSLVACSKLEPELRNNDAIAPPRVDGAPPAPTIGAVYGTLNQLASQENWFALQEHSTDELLGPTRGTDWDDFGTWRRLHLHTWGPDHNQINNVWNGFNGALFQTTLGAELLTGVPQAEAKFLRSFFRFWTMDIYGQVQSRPATAPATGIPNVILRSAAVDTAIAELESAIALLPNFNGSNRHLATKEAAWALLAKLYLNKAVYKAPESSPAGPFTFAATDMNRVIQLCDQIAANPALQIDASYWDNFKWDNGTASSENIFVRRQTDGINVVWQTQMGGHYNQTPGGWNGFTTLSNFYDAFDAADVRRGINLTGYTERIGRPTGFIVGQVRGPQGQKVDNPIVNLSDRAGNPLVFTRDVTAFFNNERNGIRTNKYPLDPTVINSDGFGWGSLNDFVLFRFADVRLMKAEAILRGGTSAETPVQIVNSIRARRNVAPAASIDLNGLLAERGRELYLEGWRRNDLIRFGRFNQPTQARSTASEAFKVIYPIPTIALSSNPNLKQNPGY